MDKLPTIEIIYSEDMTFVLNMFPKSREESTKHITELFNQLQVEYSYSQDRNRFIVHKPSEYGILRKLREFDGEYELKYTTDVVIRNVLLSLKVELGTGQYSLLLDDVEKGHKRVYDHTSSVYRAVTNFDELVPILVPNETLICTIFNIDGKPIELINTTEGFYRFVTDGNSLMAVKVDAHEGTPFYSGFEDGELAIRYYHQGTLTDINVLDVLGSDVILSYYLEDALS